MTPSRESNALIAFAKEQGQFALNQRDHGMLEINYKSFGGVVTSSDIQISKNAIELLPKITDLPVLSEEHPSSLDVDDFWIIDPIDGTSSYVQGYDGWGISIALIINNRPILGVVSIPDRQSLYFAEINQGAFCLDLINGEHRKMQVTNKTPYSLASYYHQSDYFKNKIRNKLQDFGITIEKIKPESAALKFLGVADGYYTFGGGFEPLYYWDIAAADLIVHEAGGFFCNINNHSLFRYETKDTLAVGAVASAFDISK